MDSPGPAPSTVTHARIGVLCALAVLIPYYGSAIYSGIVMQQEGSADIPSPEEMLLQVALVSIMFCGLTYALLRYVLREPLAALHKSQLSLIEDLLQAVNMSMLLMLGQIAIGWLSGAGTEQASPFNLALSRELAGNPLALFVWAGPVAWIQAALTEEFTRAFILTRFWLMWPARSAQFTALIVLSFLFGCGHYYQGSAAVAGTFVIGLVFGLHYMRYRSLRAIILGHGIYDMTVMLFLMISGRQSA